MIRMLTRALIAMGLACLAVGGQAQVVLPTTSPRVALRTVPLACFAGDSLTQFGINNTGNTRTWTTSSYITPLRWLMRGRFITSQAQVVGVSASRSDHLLAAQVPQMIAGGCDLAFIQDGTNDPAGGFTAAQTVANLSASAAQLNSANIAVIFISIAPQGGWSTAQRQMIAEVNRQLFLMSLDRTRWVRFVDINPAYSDYATGNALAGYQFSDNIHDSPAGAFAKAQLIATAIDDVLPKLPELLPYSSADAFSAALNPTGNLLTNGTMLGTTGSAAFGATGQVPSNWQIGFDSSGGSSMTIAASKTSSPSNATMPAATITFGGTGDARFMRMWSQSVAGNNSVAIPAGVVAGDRLAASCDVSWNGLTNFRYVALRLQASNGSNSYQSWDGGTLTPAGTTAVAMPQNFTGALMTTPELVVPNGMTNLAFFIEAAPMSGASLGGTVTISRCSIRKAG